MNRASRFANGNFHTFNGQEQLEFGYQNMGWRWMDNLTGRMCGIDPMHQFDSDYVGLGNQPTMRIDPDGQFAVPLIVYGVAALVGGGINLASNWSKVKNWKSGGAYFLSGAVGGVVAVTNPFAGGAITSTSNAVIDIATGNLPNLQSPSDYATYLGKEALIGGVSSYAGAQVGKLVGPQLGKVFHWSQQTFANATQQTIQIGGQNYSYAVVDAGVKLSKSWVGAAGSSLGQAAAKGGLTNPQLVQKSATLAERAIGGTGGVAGTAKHQYASKLLNRYQSIYGNRGLETGLYFNKGVGNRGFLDVIDHTNGIIYDFKFGKAVMSPAQYNKYFNNFGLPIQVIRP